MAEVIPGVAVFAVIFPDCAPLPFAQIRSPFFPRGVRVARCFEALCFLVHAGFRVRNNTGTMTPLRCSAFAACDCFVGAGGNIPYSGRGVERQPAAIAAAAMRLRYLFIVFILTGQIQIESGMSLLETDSRWILHLS